MSDVVLFCVMSSEDFDTRATTATHLDERLHDRLVPSRVHDCHSHALAVELLLALVETLERMRHPSSVAFPFPAQT